MRGPSAGGPARIAMLACGWLLVGAFPAAACSVCFSADENVLPAFYATGILLTLLPFLLIGSVGYGVHRRIKRQAELEL